MEGRPLYAHFFFFFTRVFLTCFYFRCFYVIFVSYVSASYVPLYNPVAILIRKWINLVLVFYVVSSTIFGIAIASSWHVAVIATFGGLNLIIIIAVALVRYFHFRTFLF